MKVVVDAVISQLGQPMPKQLLHCQQVMGWAYCIRMSALQSLIKHSYLNMTKNEKDIRCNVKKAVEHVSSKPHQRGTAL